MKISKSIKMLFVLGIATFFTNNATAQDVKKTAYDSGFRVGFGINGGLPTDQKVYDFALGADVRLQYDITKETSVTLTTGYTNLFRNNLDDKAFIPVKAGFKAFVWKNQFYVLGEVGGGIDVANGNAQNTYIWAPGLGYTYKNYDISVRYEDYTEYDTNLIALRLAYGFKL